MSRSRAALPGLFLLGLVFVATALLIAGFGVPVGVGLLVGLVLGAAVGLAAGLWFGAATHGGSMSIGGMNVSSAPTPFEPEMRDLLDSREVQRADFGDLVRVVAGGDTSTANGVTLELIALEIRPAGAIGHLAASQEPPGMMLGPFARAIVSDDLGTHYQAAAMGGNGSIDRLRLEVRLAPAPPAGAKVLHIRVEEFRDPFGGSRRPGVAGPWSVSVEL
jgi:hypothetical protein